MTLSVFRFHMIGLVFIAQNRVLSPSFYAQKNTVLPTLAGIFNFAVNIALASLFVGRMKGAGIALALSIASFANTVFLCAVLPRLRSVDTKKIIKSSVLYELKIIIFSLAASLPVYIVRPRLVSFFAGHGRIISDGSVVAVSALLFAAIGVALLTLTRDEIAKAACGKLLKRPPL